MFVLLVRSLFHFLILKSSRGAIATRYSGKRYVPLLRNIVTIWYCTVVVIEVVISEETWKSPLMKNGSWHEHTEPLRTERGVLS